MKKVLLNKMMNISKVEAEKVELAIVDDIKNAVQDSANAMKGIPKLLAQIGKVENEIDARLKMAERSAKEAEDKSKQVRSLAKRMGLDVPKEVEAAEKFLSRVYSDISTLEKTAQKIKSLV